MGERKRLQRLWKNYREGGLVMEADAEMAKALAKSWKREKGEAA